MGNLERVIRKCTIGMAVVSVYLTCLAAGYTVSNHHLFKSLEYRYEAIRSYDNRNNEECRKYSGLANIHEKKGEKWSELTKSVDIFHKLKLYS